MTISVRYQSPGRFLLVHRDRPNAEDLASAEAFAAEIIPSQG
jgi:hypothetical protein